MVRGKGIRRELGKWKFELAKVEEPVSVTKSDEDEISAMD